MSEVNEEEMYVEFTMIEITEFIDRYGVDFFLSRLSHRHLIDIVKEII
jgi:hypothetical protein